MRAAEYARFAAALCNADAAVPAGCAAPPGADLADRFAVYRNNVHISLIEALGERFDVVRRLVGEEFFRAMARAYVLRHKPVSAVLHEYGDGFPAFIAGFEPAAALPYLADVAALECAWSQSWAAADEAALEITALAGLDVRQLARARLRAHAAARLIRSAWPVADIWQAHQHGEPDLSGLAWRPQDVLITRPQGEVLLHVLPAAVTGFVAGLLRGLDVEAAAAAAALPAQDTGAAFGQLFEFGLVTELQTS